MPHRGVLTLDAGRVEADRWDPLHFALDVEHALVVLLTRLRLGEVPSSERDGTNHPSRNQDVSSGEDLRTALQTEASGQSSAEQLLNVLFIMGCTDSQSGETFINEH